MIAFWICSGRSLFAWSYMPILWRVRNNLESQLIHSISIWAFLMQNDVLADDAEAWRNHNTSTSQCGIIKCSFCLPLQCLAVTSVFNVHIIKHNSSRAFKASLIHSCLKHFVQMLCFAVSTFLAWIGLIVGVFFMEFMYATGGIINWINYWKYSQ